MCAGSRSISIASGAADLHPVGELEALDPRGQVSLGGKLLAVQLVQALQVIELRLVVRRRSWT